MKALIQRVSQAQVKVNNQIVGNISGGILAFIGVEKNDCQENAERLLQKIVNYRIFSDAQGKMNLSLLDIQAELLLVSQFTLVANTQKGLRPSFSSAGNPELSENLYNYLITQAKKLGIKVQTGIFAADMQVSLSSEGPVTFNLQS